MAGAHEAVIVQPGKCCHPAMPVGPLGLGLGLGLGEGLEKTGYNTNTFTHGLQAARGCIKYMDVRL